MAKRRLFLTFIVACLGVGPGIKVLSSQTTSIQAPPDTGKFIIQTVITKARENDKIKKEKLIYKRTYSVENLNDKEQVTDQEKKEVVIIELGGQERMIEKNGKSGKPENQGKASKTKIDLINVLEAVLKVDEFNVAKIDIMGDRPYYVINFKPKPNQNDKGGDVEDIIVRSEGVMYVDIEKFYIKKISAWMTRPYSRAGGLFNLSRANIEMAEEEFEGIIVMRSVTIIDKYWSILKGGTVFEKQTYEYKDYQLIQK